MGKPGKSERQHFSSILVPQSLCPSFPIHTNPTIKENLYREKKNSSRTLLVVTTSDLEKVTLELITKGVAGNLYNKNIPRSVFLLPNFSRVECSNCRSKGRSK